ncbi:hypothetical protein [Porphyromonas sp. COT-108 OH2963]|nr:hypothetical protein [Porphyromonas sp. COT-108 OH2963]
MNREKNIEYYKVQITALLAIFGIGQVLRYALSSLTPIALNSTHFNVCEKGLCQTNAGTAPSLIYD